MAKNYLNIFFQRRFKILWHVFFLKNILHGFCNNFVKFQRILIYILKKHFVMSLEDKEKEE
jgi:hypothetical protein